MSQYKNRQTVSELMDRIDLCKRFNRDDGGTSIVIHPGLSYGFIELDAEYVEKLKTYMQHKACLAASGIEPIDPATQFTAMILENCF